MSADRLFQTVCLLLEKGPMTAVQLSRLLGVSVRTVYRDVDALSAAGIPVCTTLGKGGGVSLMSSCVLDELAVSPEQLSQLLPALAPREGEEDGLALARLSALFRREEGNWLQVDLSRWGSGGWDNETFRTLRRAILSRRAVSFVYHGSHDPIRLQVLPARLLFQGQNWYLQGWCTGQEEFRTFRLSRMEELAATDQQFHRSLTPPEPDFSGDIPPMFRLDCRLRFSPRLASRVRDEFSRETIVQLPDGGLEVAAVFPDESWLPGYLLSFGSGLEILAPDSLRRRVAEEAAQLAELHAQP